jgi:hypothetical protein
VAKSYIPASASLRRLTLGRETKLDRSIDNLAELSGAAGELLFVDRIRLGNNEPVIPYEPEENFNVSGSIHMESRTASISLHPSKRSETQVHPIIFPHFMRRWKP